MSVLNPQDFLILVVDDANKNLKLVGAMLDQVGYETTFATSGEQALRRIRSAQPDLILLDLMMPQMNGLEMCRQLKEELVCQDIPVIFLTASQDKEHLFQAFEYGAVDYVTKPFNMAELLARIRVHLELKHTRDELQKALEQLEKLAITDPLTGISNRRHLLQIAEQEFALSCSNEQPFSILIIDIDFFKKINDNYGHAIGDEVIKEMIKVAKCPLRGKGILGRFGGEEFVAFLPQTELVMAIEISECIRSEIAATTLAIEEFVIHLTVSIGVSTYQRDDVALEDLLKRADLALYRAKNSGRNKVCWG